MKKFFFFLFSFCVTTVCIHAQTSANTSGGEGKGTGGNISYSVGQGVSAVFSGTTGSIYAGVQQAYTIIPVLSNPLVTLKVEVYPNPTTDFLILSFGEQDAVNCNAKLIDVGGKLLSIIQLRENKTKIDVSYLAAGTYFLRVETDKKESIAVFKVIKQ